MFKKFSYPLTILERHLDTFGHVNNAVYLQIYEEARWDLITKNGYGWVEIQKLKQGPVILDVHCSFLRELKLRQEIVVETGVVQLKKAVSEMKQRIVNANGEVYSEAIFKFGLFDLTRRKLIAPTELWLKAIGADSSLPD